MNDLKDLEDWFDNRGASMVALSGGVDSALVALAAYRRLGTLALAVTADYMTLSAEELISAKTISKEIGIRHTLLHYNELENEEFAKNDDKRCLYCRTELAERLLTLADETGINTIVDGTHVGDLGDYRPGIAAMKQHGIKSPLAELGFTKDDIRREANLAGMSVSDRPSNSCLASRIPWGQRVTAQRLARVELGETFVKNSTDIRHVRVRDIDGAAKIEVDPSNLEKISNASMFGKIDAQLKMIGFKSVTVDPDGYRPGKANVIAD